MNLFWAFSKTDLFLINNFIEKIRFNNIFALFEKIKLFKAISKIKSNKSKASSLLNLGCPIITAIKLKSAMDIFFTLFICLK